MIENVTNPGAAPVEGDQIRITRPSGGVIEKIYHEPPLPTAPITHYKTLDAQSFLIDLVAEAKPDAAVALEMAMEGLGPAAALTAEQRAVIKAVVRQVMTFQRFERDSTTLATALNALVTANVLTAVERQAIYDNWPIEA